jgi:hypothetical protein
MYRRIQSIRIICYSLFLLVNNTHGLQIVIGHVYKVGVHVFINGHTKS